jgi:hypothetical protein
MPCTDPTVARASSIRSSGHTTTRWNSSIEVRTAPITFSPFPITSLTASVTDSSAAARIPQQGLRNGIWLWEGWGSRSKAISKM